MAKSRTITESTKRIGVQETRVRAMRERHEEVQRHGNSALGRSELLKFLKTGARLTPGEMIKAKCYECSGFFVDTPHPPSRLTLGRAAGDIYFFDGDNSGPSLNSAVIVRL
jgi:hypothetical protein